MRNNLPISTNSDAAHKMDGALGHFAMTQLDAARISGDGNSPETTMAEDREVSVRIALAEDEPDIRKMFVLLLERLGHEVIFAVANGAELLDQSLEENVDVVFVDLDMPVMDGLAAAEEVERRGLPVILVSGHPDSESVVLDHEPIVARISKPASIDSLRNAIRTAMAGR